MASDKDYIRILRRKARKAFDEYKPRTAKLYTEAARAREAQVNG